MTILKKCFRAQTSNNYYFSVEKKIHHILFAKCCIFTTYILNRRTYVIRSKILLALVFFSYCTYILYFFLKQSTQSLCVIEFALFFVGCLHFILQAHFLCFFVLHLYHCYCRVNVFVKRTRLNEIFFFFFFRFVFRFSAGVPERGRAPGANGGGIVTSYFIQFTTLFLFKKKWL